jgi:hypothetical protein
MIKAHPEIRGLYVSGGPAVDSNAGLFRIWEERIYSFVTSDSDLDVAVNIAKGGVYQRAELTSGRQQGVAMAYAGSQCFSGQRKVTSFIGVQPYAVLPQESYQGLEGYHKDKEPQVWLMRSKRTKGICSHRPEGRSNFIDTSDNLQV